MIKVVYKKKGLKINAVWFCNDIDKTVKTSEADLVFLHGVSVNNFKTAIISEQFSLITDLKAPSEHIFREFCESYRRQISKAQKEGVQCININSSELKNNMHLINLFKRQYNDFVKLKGIKNTYNEQSVEQYIKTGSIILTKAIKDDFICAQHIYVCDGKTARLLYSVSNFRTEGIDSNLVGRANKYLHWNDIQYLQNNKVQILDWGGISSIDNPNGIDFFKKGFGGIECSYYNVIIGKTIKGKLVVWLINLKRGIDNVFTKA